MFQSLQAKLVINIITFGFILGGILGAGIYYLFPKYYTDWYFAVLVFFIAIEAISLLMIEKLSRTATAGQLANSYLMSKTVKIIFSLAFISMYAVIVKDKPLILNFAISFILLYFIFLVLESIQFVKIEKNLKNKKQ